MATTLDDVINSLPSERREKIEHLTVELVEEVATLRELRKKQKLTQADISQLLGEHPNSTQCCRAGVINKKMATTLKDRKLRKLQENAD